MTDGHSSLSFSISYSLIEHAITRWLRSLTSSCWLETYPTYLYLGNHIVLLALTIGVWVKTKCLSLCLVINEMSLNQITKNSTFLSRVHRLHDIMSVSIFTSSH